MDAVDEIDYYRNEVVRLKSEITELERKKETLDWLAVGAVSYYELSRLPEDQTYATKSSLEFSEPNIHVDQKVFLLKNQLSMFKTATGISVNDVIAEPLDDGSIKYVLKGSSHGVLFELQFHESKDGHHKDGKFHIDNLEIDSMEIINTELQYLLDMCEDQSSLGLFFSVFVPFVRCLSNREASFASIRQRFPEFVDLTGATLKFHPPNKRVTFEIHWSVAVNNVFTVVPVVRLEVGGIGINDRVFNSACDQFAEMVDALGPTRAIDAFATSICAELKHE